MNVLLNGVVTSAEFKTVHDLLAALGIDPDQQGIAVALNHMIVQRTQWKSTALAENDRVELITAMQGG